MSEPAADAQLSTQPSTVRVPPGPRLPKAFQGTAFIAGRRWLMQQMAGRYGGAFTLNLPVYGRTVVIADPQLAKQIFSTSPEDLGNIRPNLSRLLGPGSVFALDGEDHRRRRRLLAPPFHDKSIKNYEKIIEEETLREIAGWPTDEPFATLPSMMRITLNAILRAVFGAEGAELDQLRRVLPPWVTLGSRLASVPKPSRTYGRYSPWGRLAEWRRRYDAVVDKLVADERADPNFADRSDVLGLMLRSSCEDGSAMSRTDLGDELLTLLAAGHETTAATLGWAFERLSRHPDISSALAEEADTDGNELRQAAILEVQRTRTVIDMVGRHVLAPMYELGDWGIPRGYSIVVSLGLIPPVPTCSPIRTVSTLSGTSAASRRHRRGFRSVAVPAAASERLSPTWKWTWCCELCCGTSSSKPPRLQMRSATLEVSRSRPRTAAGSWCIGVPAEPIRSAAMTATSDSAQRLDVVNAAMETTFPLAHKIGLRVSRLKPRSGAKRGLYQLPAQGK